MVEQKVQIVCSFCGSANVRRDASAEWDAETQKWVLCAVYDQGYCESCNDESMLIEKLLG